MLTLQPSLGALEIGFLASGFLFGVLTAQALIYHRKFIQDSWALKLMVRLFYMIADFTILSASLVSKQVGVIWYVASHEIYRQCHAD